MIDVREIRSIADTIRSLVKAKRERDDAWVRLAIIEQVCDAADLEGHDLVATDQVRAALGSPTLEEVITSQADPSFPRFLPPEPHA